ncbi:hypothetical protein [Shinella zoogloeoides]|uniref:hypothetical protein n=1 Tax=Shinella zoogloeoides TaxID=352475 RepID=UPI00273EBFA3|nr:hypothetical protein [Shinella zoogloeoides]WLR90992.1 hypothetical protein Q9316_00155 [Shinella zoogloeoides]
MAVKQADQKNKLRAFYDRRHPRYNLMAAHWHFLEAAYAGGREWFIENIFRYHKEGEEEFGKRRERAYRFNHTKEVVDLIQKYLFKGVIARKEDGTPDVVKEFWKRATLSGHDITQFMSSSSGSNSVFGRVAIVVDNNMKLATTEEGAARPLSVAEAKQSNFRIYSYIVNAIDILDYAYDEDGDGGLLWIKLREHTRDDADPLEDTGDVIERVRLWTRSEWILFEEEEVKVGRRTEKVVREIGRQAHDLGVVPVILHDHTIEAKPYEAPGLIDDIAYLDRAVTNYLSNLDAIIQDQTFSQLAIPANAIAAGDDMYSKVLELGTKRIFVYDPGQGSTAKPEFLSPDPKQAGVILAVINKIINEIYHTVGLAGERTKEDNAVGIDNSSGVAKAYDFERVNSLLLTKAQSCQNAENKIVDLVCRWAGVKAPEEDLVTYPTTFDVMRLVDDLVTAEALAKLTAPIEVRREHMRQMVEKLFPQLADDLKETIRKDIDGWLEGTDVLLAAPTAFGGQKPTAAPGRQGQVTSKSPNKQPASTSK